MVRCRMNRWWQLGIATSLAVGGAITFEEIALSQIAPDTTLGAERSVVTPNVVINGLSSERIDGGAIRGKNLFHSFQEFSVSEGRGAYFTSPVGIKNILSRVTGNNLSQIFGKLGVLQGNANLFLINPNGIIFGPHASLDVGGSFVATTSNGIGFGNQGFFMASAPNIPPLLTVNPSALLFNQISAGSISNNSREPAGQLLENLSENSTPLFGLRVPDGQSLLLAGGNVSLDGGGLNALGGRVELGGLAGAGTVELDVNGNNLHLSLPSGVARADISLSNKARVDVSGDNGGDIQVQGKRITLTDSSQIAANTLGAKPGGALALNASDSVELSSFTRYGTLTTQTLGAGDAGDIVINTRKLIVRDLAELYSITSGKGSGGKLTVVATDSVELIGSTPDANSGLFSFTTAAGTAGDITIKTGRLLVQGGATVSADSSGTGTLENFIPATGRGGKLTLIVPKAMELIGGLLSTDTLGSGDAGSMIINTGKLILQDGAKVSATSEGIGKAGDIQVRASSIRLNNQGTLTSETASGEGGNITLQQVQDLQLRHNSKISTNPVGSGNGGNITIDTGTLVPLENSNISANAFGGQGGNVRIKTQGLFPSPDSKITAASERGPQFDGVVQINTLVNNPSQGLVNLPVKPVDVTGLIAQGCPTGVGPRGSKFILTGHGGLPPTPREALGSEPPLADLGTPLQGQENHASAATSTSPTNSD